MKKKSLLLTALIFMSSIACLLVFFITDFSDDAAGDPTVRTPTSTPADYEALSAKDKQEILWREVLETEYKNQLPELDQFGAPQLFAMSGQAIRYKKDHFSDFAPRGWRKFLHRRGLVAKVKIVPEKNDYTGLFQGADHGLIRLSLTFRPKGKRNFAPGLALKVLRDGAHSANISALVALDGQGKDFNFFKNPLSNIVPIEDGIGFNLMHRIFKRVTSYPEELLLDDLARFDASGHQVRETVSPRQIFFLPAEGLGTPSEEHDFRTSVSRIKSGTILYHVHAAPPELQSFDYEKYTHEDAVRFREKSRHIADIVMTSDFVASSFGDEGIFFRHEVRPKRD